jgi:hypothetical protein
MGHAGTSGCGAGFFQHNYIPASIFGRGACSRQSGAATSDDHKIRFEIFGSHTNTPPKTSLYLR